MAKNQTEARGSWVHDLLEKFKHVTDRDFKENMLWFKEKGFLGILQSANNLARGVIAMNADKKFDRKYGTNTGGYKSTSDFDTNYNQEVIENAVHYLPTSIECFKFLMQKIDIDFSKFSFVDFGSGKGRVLFLAREIGYQNITGVELCKDLSEIAHSNKEILERQGFDVRNLETVSVNATEFPIPSGPCVLYFFSPFKSPILDQVLENIQKSWYEKKREIFIVFADHAVDMHLVPKHIFEKKPFVEFSSGLVPKHFASTEQVAYFMFKADASDE